MTEGGHAVSQAQLKRDLDLLSKQIFDIDLAIQRQGPGNTQTIANFEAAKVKIQKEIVAKQIELELKQAQNKKARQARC